MELYIDGYGNGAHGDVSKTKAITKYNEVDINLKYDCVGDTFSYKLYFDPSIKQYRDFYQPGTYKKCQIRHKGVLVMTGTILNHKFSSAGAPPRQYVDISGYSVTGVLEDSVYTGNTQFTGMSIGDIAKQICNLFSFQVIIDDEVAGDCAAVLAKTNIKPDQTIKSYLDDICKQKNIVLSHDTKGNLLLTRAKSKNIKTTQITRVTNTAFTSDIVGAPETTTTKQNTESRPILYSFKEDDGSWLEMSLAYNGRMMHGVIEVVGDYTGKANATEDTIINPFVNASSPGGERYQRIVQTSKSEDINDTQKTARNYLGDELKNVTLSITIEGWELNGNLVVPNQLITVQNPDIYLFEPTTFFIQEVNLRGNETYETATMTCVVPEAFNDDPVKYIF